MPPRPCTAAGCEMAAVWPDCSALLILRSSLARPVKLCVGLISGWSTVRAARQYRAEHQIGLVPDWLRSRGFVLCEFESSHPRAGQSRNSENSKANRIETMKGPAESGQICSVGRRKIAKKIAKNKRCYANTLRPRSRMLLKVMKGG